MLNDCILIFSGFLFAIGLLGCLIERSNIIKVMLSIEIMILASVVNFCCFNLDNNVLRIGYIFAVTGIIISGVVLSIVFAIKIHSEKEDRCIDE